VAGETPPRKKEGTAPFRLCVYVRVCDCLYLKKKNEAERHLGSGLDGKSPYQVSAQQLKMQLNSSIFFFYFFQSSASFLGLFYFSPFYRFFLFLLHTKLNSFAHVISP
jgi:hypothetical protein